ncbi:MAG: glycine C-acetyltransferase [Bowdeniella nasicola]|nr:glycine C-acetyltransferase [Bowdeniella nasicola]
MTRDAVAEFLSSVSAELGEIEQAGLYKRERELTTAQSARIATTAGASLNFCANNYLGLADDPRIVTAAKDALEEWGFGMASVRFICGTQSPHRALEEEIADYLGLADSILFSSCFDANGGLFEVFFGPEDAIVSDSLNHASLIDGIRLTKAKRLRYANADLDDLRARLEEARDANCRRIAIVTDGVFSMDGSYAPLEGICDLADEFGALVIVDDSHATGFVGEQGRGTHELLGVMGRVDIITGTLGKALGGASGGFVAGPSEVVDLLRQKARPYLFSNAVAPAVVAGSRQALSLARAADAERVQLRANAALFRSLMEEEGFDLLPGTHPIIAVMFPGDDGARLATEIADAMLDDGVYVIAFSFPVVPRGKARIRVQLSAGHTEADIRACVRAFVEARARVAGN